MTKQRHSRDALAALLWPDYDQARAALRRTLSALNKAIGPEWIDSDRESLALARSADVRVDVERFLARIAACRAHGHPTGEVCDACLEPLAEAAALYRGDFLAGFTLRDSPEFDDWQLFQTESLRRELAGALERLVAGYAMRGDFEMAIATARRWLALDPLHEPAHRQLMQLYARADQRAAAIQQYRECVRVLEQELGVPPLEETTRLYQAIVDRQAPPSDTWRAGAPAAERGHPGDAASAVPVQTQRAPEAEALPLVGRAAEWERLIVAYETAGPNGYVVTLEGEAGIGKTRLAEEFLAYARAAGATTIAARCYEGEASLAYAPIAAALRAGLARAEAAERLPPHWFAEVARLLPELATLRPGLQPAPPLDSPDAQLRFFEGVVEALLAICAGQAPGVLFLDDLHWADSASIDLLTYLTRRLRDRPLLILLTWRGEQAPQRLRLLLAEARRAGGGATLTLEPLSRAAVVELVRAARADAPPELSERLYRASEGSPFVLNEYLAALAHGPLSDASLDQTLPGAARDLLHTRLAAADETGRQLLSAAAAIGRSFDFDTLRVASGRSEEEIVEALERLIARRLIVESHAASAEAQTPLSYDFSHAMLRDLVYEETSLARRRLLHRRIAEALAGRARGPRELGALAGQIAHHYQLAGRAGEAAEHFRLAGEHARALFANAEALAHFRAALALGHSSAAALHEAIGDLLTLAGDYGAAITSYETAAALAEPAVLAGLEHKLGQVHHRRGAWDLAERHFQAALEAAAPPAMQARLYADWSLTAHQRGRSDAALALAQQALDLARSADDLPALALAHNMLGVLARSQGDLPTAQRHLEQSLALAEALGDPGARAAALNNLALVHSASGAIERALALAEAGVAICAEQGDRHREAALRNNLADLLHAAGRSEEAMTHLKRAVAIFAEIGMDAGEMRPEIWKLTEW